MLTLLFSLLGGGGLGVLAWFFLPGAKDLIGGVLKAIPRPVWYAALAALALWLGWQWVQSEKRAAWKDGFTAGEKLADTKWQCAFGQMERAARKWRDNYETRSDQLTDARRQNHENDLRRNADLADAIRLQGPGKAALSCPGGGTATGLAQITSGPGEAPSGPDAPAGPVPADNRPGGFAIVPWTWLVERAKDHDDLRSRVQTLKAHDAEQKELWNDRREELRKALDEIRPEW